MKLTIDTTAKTITIDGLIKIDDLIEKLSELKKDYPDYEVDASTTTVYIPYTNPIYPIHPVYPTFPIINY